MSDQTNQALVGVNIRGEVTAVIALEHSTNKEIREFYISMADTDRTVERTTVEDARKRFHF